MAAFTIIIGVALLLVTVAVAVFWPEQSQSNESRNQRILKSEIHKQQAAWFERNLRN